MTPDPFLTSEILHDATTEKFKALNGWLDALTLAIPLAEPIHGHLGRVTSTNLVFQRLRIQNEYFRIGATAVEPLLLLITLLNLLANGPRGLCLTFSATAF